MCSMCYRLKMDVCVLKRIFVGVLMNALLFAEIDAVRCSVYSRYSNPRRYIHCSESCCGPAGDQYCCEKGVGIGTIIWITIAVFVAVVVTWVIMCCRRRKSSMGQLVETQQHQQSRALHMGAVFPTGTPNPSFPGTGSTIPNTQSEHGYAQLNPGTLTHPGHQTMMTSNGAVNYGYNPGAMEPPSYETVMNIPPNTPPKYYEVA